MQDQPLDPIRFEVLRHRLWSVAAEAASAIKNISGSPIASEAHDFNTCIMNPQGDSVVMGPYVASLAIGQGLIVRTILEKYSENPGAFPGDMFLCNDPYSGALHQNDVTLVAPVFYGEELIAWTGATIHQVDVGGASKGSQAATGAKSIFEEAPVIPPVKIIERGTLRRDLEEEYLIRSRTRDLNALDLRAKIAANLVMGERVLAVAERYGIEALGEVFNRIIDVTEAKLRARLRELPNGSWSHTSYIDYDRAVYAIRLKMTKLEDELVLDFTESSPQAPAVANCTFSGLLAGVQAGVLAYLCYDIPMCPAGILRPLRIVSKKGTVVEAAWPAGAAKATTAGSFVTTTVVSACLAKMLDASEQHCSRLMACWNGASGQQELFGTDQRGQPFGSTILDGMAGGAGARYDRDGIDTGGFVRSLACAIANVETYEFRYPLLYLYRRQEPDTGGAGRFRGGVGVGLAMTPHDVEEIPTCVVHGCGIEQPASSGIGGGYPGSTTQFNIRRDTSIQERLERGEVPVDFNALDGVLEPKSSEETYLKKGDVFERVACGGGGFGDPLERDPEMVLADVRNGLVSMRCAEEIYGVVLEEGYRHVNVERTRNKREEMRRVRGSRI
ncbi:MAG: hydantoinase B/oxoprolinase family protein [Deltaproteobacteria bacterium]|nr:hydantoinase B/oxoprolinase family protein [Deltaproteobacteria bacterium]